MCFCLHNRSTSKPSLTSTKIQECMMVSFLFYTSMHVGPLDDLVRMTCLSPYREKAHKHTNVQNCEV